MTLTRSIQALVVLFVTFLASWPASGQTRPFVKFSGVVGPIGDGRHAGWAEAESWVPTTIPGQECDRKRGWLRCLDGNGHHITMLLRAEKLSPAMRDALKVGTAFSEVKIEDYQGDNFISASTLTLSNVRISDLTSDQNSALSVTLTYRTLSSRDEWAEPTILIGPKPGGR